MTVWYFEIYTKGPAGESGWDIKVGYVEKADSYDDALAQIVLHFHHEFGEVIQLYEAAGLNLDNPVVIKRGEHKYKVPIVVEVSVEHIYGQPIDKSWLECLARDHVSHALESYVSSDPAYKVTCGEADTVEDFTSLQKELAEVE